MDVRGDDRLIHLVRVAEDDVEEMSEGGAEAGEAVSGDTPLVTAQQAADGASEE